MMVQQLVNLALMDFTVGRKELLEMKW